jgi:acetylornithine deacetylase/succinyl-diaminopimelate desuccinylase-like protein
MNEELVALAKRLIGYETVEPGGISEAAGFVKGWLEARGIEAERDEVRGLPVVRAEVGPATAPTVVLHGHLDVVPGRPGQFDPRVEGDRLFGRGAYDMKGAIAAMLLVAAEMRDQDRVRVRLGIVGDEESEEEAERGSDHLVDSGFTGDFAITGEPTDLHIGVEAKGVLALRLEVAGRSAHGATPWLGDNAVLNAIDVFRSIESLPFARHSSELFDRPSINLGRIWGGDALNKVPDRCVIDVDIRYLPDQDPGAGARDRGDRGRAAADAAAGDGRARLGLRPGAAPGRLRAPSRRADERRPRRRLRRGLLPAGGGAGGRVRPGRRRPPRARGVGLGLLVGDLPAGARVLPAGDPGAAR